ncbi:Mersacidin decarboxylase [Alkalicoccobacillus porphyridii]|uniref:Mersacidin decarboxylase n=2 Tax=Alkalicoccobacillus porphyridii TaxID=2597270 RepID=A0A553ZY44_9BACI|nr:Mersacidin decarboxylase [Alkalicoccobacillus porphyridii]
MPSYLAFFNHTYGNVKVIITEQADKLFPASSLSLFCNDIFQDNHETIHPSEVSHVGLARWSDLFIVLPATANKIGQVANGLGMDLLSSTILASKSPVLFCPNMNEAMWNNFYVKRNLALLEEGGHIIIPPVEKEAYEVASGSIRKNYIIPDVYTIVQEMDKIISKREES